MKVLIAHNRYRFSGGEERHVELLESGLLKAGVAVRRFERQSAAVYNSPIRKVAAGLALTYRPGAGGINPMLREWRPSIVHFNNIWPLLTPSALRAAKRSGAVVVLTVHNFRFACPGGRLLRGGVVHEDCIDGSSFRCALRSPHENRVESLAYGIALELQRRLHLLERWVDAFISPSEFVARMLVRSGVSEHKVHVIPHGLPIPPSEPGGRDYALYAGRLAHEKGILTLLEAAKLAPTVPLAIAGDGPLTPQVREARGTVHYRGLLGRNELRTVLSDAAFTILASEWHENLPFSALESLAAGKPVVATRMGGLPEAVTDGVTGILVGPGDAPALARAMVRVWDNRSVSDEMGKRGREIAELRYSLEGQTRKLIELYEESGA